MKEASMGAPAGHPVQPKAVVGAIVFDKLTGRVVQRIRVERLEDDTTPIDLEKLVSDAADDPFTMRMISGGDRKNLSAMVVAAGAREAALPSMVDVGARRLVPLPRLALTASKTQLEGDGKDTAELEVALVDAKGKRIPGFDAEIEISTSRGKLSARGGRIKLSGGVGRVKLTSAAETVAAVEVTARSLGAPAESAHITLAFL